MLAGCQGVLYLQAVKLNVMQLKAKCIYKLNYT